MFGREDTLIHISVIKKNIPLPDGQKKNPAKRREKFMLRKIIEKLFWHCQEKENWKMKMDEPIAIKKISREEADRILEERRRKNER